MSNPNPMFLEKPLSLAHARSLFAASDPKKLALLAPLLPHDYGVVKDEFIELNAAYWTVPVTAGGGPTAFVLDATVRGSSLVGDTGATDDDVIAIHAKNASLNSADNPWFFLQWKVDIVTSFSFEIGLSDPKTSEVLPAVTDIDTPAVGNGVTDVVCIHMDTDQTLTTAELIGDGTTGAVTASTGPSLATAAYTPTAAAWQTMLIGVRENLGYCSIWDGDAFIGHFSVGNGPDADILLAPYAMFRTRDTNADTVTLRKFEYGWEQNG